MVCFFIPKTIRLMLLKCSTPRYLDDLLNIDNPYSEQRLSQI